MVRDLPTHVDFMRIHGESRISLYIHVDFVNLDKAPGIKRGGTLTVMRSEIELEVMAGDIPDHITVDLTGKEIGDLHTHGGLEIIEVARRAVSTEHLRVNSTLSTKELFDLLQMYANFPPVAFRP